MVRKVRNERFVIVITFNKIFTLDTNSGMRKPILILLVSPSGLP
jgi:hypothetical protein